MYIPISETEESDMRSRTHTPAASPEAAQSLAALDRSQALLRGILLGVSLQYQSLSMERAALLGCPAPGPDPAAVQVAASLASLWALLGFHREALALADRDPDGAGLSAASVLIALIRLLRLLEAPALGNLGDPAA